jgi:hypothetical protein
MSRKKPITVVQSIELIEAVIEHVRANPHAISGFCGDHPLQAPRPLPAEQLEHTFRSLTR